MYNLILCIETSCDETSLAFIVNTNNNSHKNYLDFLNGFPVLYQIISSQVNIHSKYGGVIPEIGARHHSASIHLLFEKLLQESVNRLLEKVKMFDAYNVNNLKEVEYTDDEKLIVKTFQPKLGITENEIVTNILQPYNFQITDLKTNPLNILKMVNCIMVTSTPGLTSSLKVGIEFAKSIKFYLQKNYLNNVDLQLIDHLNGHVASCFYNVE